MIIKQVNGELTVPDYYDEASELAAKAVKRLNVCKLAVEYLYHKDQYDADELRFAEATENAWPTLTELQKNVVYMHLIQGFSFSGIGELKGYSRKNASKSFYLACKKFQKSPTK